jgi:hypothetical protein
VGLAALVFKGWLAGNPAASRRSRAARLLSLTTLVPLTTGLAVCTLLPNGIAGLVFGYVYWRHGMLLAMGLPLERRHRARGLGAVLG